MGGAAVATGAVRFISVFAVAIMKRVMSVNGCPPTVTGTGISNCGKGADGTLTGRWGESSSPDAAIHIPFRRNWRHAGTLERIAQSAVYA